MHVRDGIWPLPILDGVKPTVSDGFGVGKRGRVPPDGHLGADMMYRRRANGTPALPEMTKGFFCPSNTVEVYACLPGTIFTATRGSTGFFVTIDHGNVEGFGPMSTQHLHLSRLFVTESRKGARSNQRVERGQRIGIVGNNPSEGGDPNHLHFEIWDLKRLKGEAFAVHRVATDPGPFLAGWGMKHQGGSGAIVPGTGNVPGATGAPGASPLDALPGVEGGIFAAERSADAGGSLAVTLGEFGGIAGFDFGRPGPGI